MVWVWAAVAALLVVIVAALALRRRGAAPPTTDPTRVAEPVISTAPAPPAPDPATEIALEAGVEPPAQPREPSGPSDRLEAAPPVEAPAPQPAPVMRGASAEDDGPGVPPPSGFAVKGNVASMIYHTPDSPYFARTRAEVWFNTEEAAREAGFRRWDQS